MPTLVKLNSNWADEMDVDGFCITLDNQEQVKQKLKENFIAYTLYNISEKDLNLSPEDLQIYKEAKRKYKPCTVTISKATEEFLLVQEIEVCIGTNEELIFDGFDHYLEEHTIEEITQEEYQTIKKLFGEKYGQAPRLKEKNNVTFKVV